METPLVHVALLSSFSGPSAAMMNHAFRVPRSSQIMAQRLEYGGGGGRSHEALGLVMSVAPHSAMFHVPAIRASESFVREQATDTRRMYLTNLDVEVVLAVAFHVGLARVIAEAHLESAAGGKLQIGESQHLLPTEVP